MAKFLEFAIFCFVQMIAFFAILIGAGFVRPLMRLFQAIREGDPWQFSELARLTACVFGPILTGILLILGGIAWLVYSSGFRKRMRAFPEQTWLWRSDWANGIVSLSNRSVLVIFLITVSVYGLVVVPAGIYLASLKNAALVYSFLGATGFFLLIFFRIQWANRLWNHSVLQMHTLPGIIGQQFSGLIVIPESFPGQTTFQVRLKCEVTQSSSTRNSHQNDLVSVLTDTQTTGKTRSTSYRTVSADPVSCV